MNTFRFLYLPKLFKQEQNEQLLPFFLFLLTFLLFLLMILRLTRKSSRPSSTPNLPPGPRKLPIIGNLHLFIMSSLPHHLLRNLATKYGPLMHLKLGEISLIVVSSSEATEEMMRTHDVNFSQRPLILAASMYYSVDIAFAPYGDYWRQLRKVCTLELLSLKRVQSFRSIREEEVSQLVTSLHANKGSLVNVSEKIFSLMYSVTARAAVGKKREDEEAFIALVKEGLRLGGGFSVYDVFPSQSWIHWISGMKLKFEEIFKKSDEILDNIIVEYKAKKARKVCGDDHKDNIEAESLLDVLFNLERNEEFSLEARNIKAVIMDILLAGSETASVTIEWTMLEMLKNPTVMEKAQKEVRQVFGSKQNINETSLHELEFLHLVIKETLRLHPPNPLVARESKESCVINGYLIPPKTKILVNAWALGRDPKYWIEPNKFYPERFLESSIDFKGNDFEFIPFGGGRRMCPGISFAMATIKLLLAQLLFHFDWKLPKGISHDNLDMSESFGLTVRRNVDLYLIPTPRHE